ncbi:MAG: hypothetical protein RL417_1907 [Pseudomonadota bacterium]|jgi:hypothetical protein
MELSGSETLIFVFGLVVTLIWSAMLGILFRGIDEGSEAVKTQSPDSEGVHPGRGAGIPRNLSCCEPFVTSSAAIEVLVLIFPREWGSA